MNARSSIGTENHQRRLGKSGLVSVALVLLLALTASSCTTVEPSKGRRVVPGLTLYESPEPLTGKLLFLTDTNYTSLGDRRPGETAVVYECDLADQTIRNVTIAPRGEFVPSAKGDTFAVLWAEQNPAAHTYDIKAWGYSERTRQAKTTTLYSDINSYMPGSTVVVGESAFFDVWSAQGGGPGILRFDFATGQKGFLGPLERAAWHSTNGVQNPFGLHCADGSYVFFEGSEAPINGYMLLSSPVDSFHTKLGDIDGKSVRVLKRFSRLSGGYYSLNALSPCGHYVFVCHNESSLTGGLGHIMLSMSPPELRGFCSRMRLAEDRRLCQLGVVAEERLSA